jgi:hypothetical protein
MAPDDEDRLLVLVRHWRVKVCLVLGVFQTKPVQNQLGSSLAGSRKQEGDNSVQDCSGSDLYPVRSRTMRHEEGKLFPRER